MSSMRGPADTELPYIAAIQVMFESELLDLSEAVQVAIHLIGTAPLHNYFAIVGGEVGSQLRGITWYAIHDRMNPKFKDWLQSGDPNIEAGINRLIECANEFGLETDDL